MDIKKFFLGALVAMASVSVSAQEQPQTVEEFNPHWYIQGQVGGQYTLGEIDFGKLLSPNAQIAGGYQFSPIFGARLAVNAWQSKGGSKLYGNEYKWKWNYVAPTVDLTINLCNLFGGYKYDRLFNLGLFVGAGANFAWNNDEARDVRALILNGTDNVAPVLGNTPEYMEYCPDWKHVRFVGQFGVTGDFRLSDAVSLGLELGCNLLSDTYNSKKAGNTDWYFNGLVGIRYNFGETHKTKVLPQPEPVVVYRDRPERETAKVAPAATVAEKTAPVPPVQAKRETLRRDVFFLIRGSDISTTEQPKVDEVVAYMKKYPDAKVSVTGYADRGTGNPRINMKYSEARAKVVADYLKANGIDASRITVKAKGDTEQPFPDNNSLNRASICIAE